MLPTQLSNKRLLTIYTRSADNAFYKQQVQLLAEDKPGLEDRNMVIQTFVYNDSNASAFKKARIKSNFAVVLTGKDGGEKFRSTKPITLKDLYAIIDAMPMRRQEMRKN